MRVRSAYSPASSCFPSSTRCMVVSMSLTLFSKSGDKVEGDHAVARVRGRARTLLECERVSLNFIQRLSRRRDSRPQVCRCRRGDQMQGSRHTEDNAGLPAPGEARGSRRRRDKPPDRTCSTRSSSRTTTSPPQAASGLRWSVSVRRSFPPTLQSKSRSERAKNSTKRLSAGAWHVLLDNLTPKQAAAEIRLYRGPRESRVIGQYHARYRFALTRRPEPISCHAARSRTRRRP